MIEPSTQKRKRRSKYYIFSEISYSFLRQRHQILAEMLADDFDVTFVERIPSRIPIDIASRFIAKLKEKFCREGKNSRRPININCRPSLMLPHLNPVFKLVNMIRARIILRDAEANDIVHLFANAPAVAKEAKRRGCIVVVDVIHNWWEFPYHQAAQRSNIRRALSKADLIISDSQVTLDMAVLDAKAEHSEYQSLLMPPGVQDFWFTDPSKPDPVSCLKCVFFGNLRANSDLKIICELINSDGVTLELYGLLDPSLPADILDKIRPYFKGARDQGELVDCLRDCDAIVLPYDKSGFSSTIFPAKYYEAMALGKPIISDSGLDHLPFWLDFVWTSKQVNELGFETLFDEHYDKRCLKQIEIARRNTWEMRVAKLKDTLNDL